MEGSGTIRVMKRDGSVEDFDAAKLAAAMWRAMRHTNAKYTHARQLAEAIETYLLRRDYTCVSTRALFEMAVKSLHYVGLPRAAGRIEKHRDWRDQRRRQFRIRHDDSTTFWDKSWLCKLACRSWHVSHSVGRIIAGRIEHEILAGDRFILGRHEVLDLLNHNMAAYGLADAVPVEQV